MFGTRVFSRIIRLKKHSSAPASVPLTYAALPKVARVSLLQYNGLEAKSIVRRGERVTEGQIIAEGTRDSGVTMHSPVPGIILGIFDIILPNEKKTKIIEIQTGGVFRKNPNITPRNINSLNRARILAELADKGVVDHNIEAIPAHLKYGDVNVLEYLIIPLEDIDPYNVIQERIILDYPQSFHDGLIILTKILEPKVIILCSTKNKQHFISQVTPLIPGSITVQPLIISHISALPLNEIIQTHLQNKLAKTQTGPLISDINIVYPSFLYQLQQSILFRRPCIDRPITVAGGALKKPSNMFIRIGTPVRFVCEECGGFKKESAHIMMGTLQSGFEIVDLDTPINKNTSMLLALSQKEATKIKHVLNTNNSSRPANFLLDFIASQKAFKKILL